MNIINFNVLVQELKMNKILNVFGIKQYNNAMKNYVIMHLLIHKIFNNVNHFIKIVKLQNVEKLYVVILDLKLIYNVQLLCQIMNVQVMVIFVLKENNVKMHLMKLVVHFLMILKIVNGLKIKIDVQLNHVILHH